MKLLSRLVIALLICLLAIPMLVTPAQANPGFSLRNNTSYTGLDRDEGYVGDVVRIYGDWDNTHGSYIHIYYELFAEDEDDWYYKKVYRDHTDFIDPFTYYYFDYDLKIPESCAGEHDILICDDDDPDDVVNTLHFTVYPFIEIDKEKGPAGTTVEVTGTGWDEDEDKIEIRFYLQDPGTTHYDDDDYYVEIPAQDIDINDRGSWEDVTFEVPPASKGNHWIYAVGDECDDIDDYKIIGVQFEITPGISISTTEGYIGDTVTVSGSGFEEDEEDINVTYNGDVVADTEADENGCWEVTFEVPQSALGEHKIDAYGKNTKATAIADRSFSIAPQVILTPTEGHVGTSLTVSGSGLPAGETVTVTYDGVSTDSATVDANGVLSDITFAATHTQSEHTAEHPVVVSCDTITFTFTFTMESDTPPNPALALPANASRLGFIRKQAPTFEWSVVTDDSGVSYDFEIAKSADFAQVLISKTGLTETSYALTEAEALDYGTYYWRVKAIDGALNDSGWTTAYSFKSTLLPLWAFVAIVALAAVLIGVLIYTLIRRRGMYYD